MDSTVAFLIPLTVTVAVVGLFWSLGSARQSQIEDAVDSQSDSQRDVTVRSIPILYRLIKPPGKAEWAFKRDQHDETTSTANAIEVSCTCRRFVERRRQFPPNDLRRLCKHLLKAFDSSEVWPVQDEIIEALIAFGPTSGGCSPYSRFYLATLAPTALCYVGMQKGKPWVDVYARSRRPGEIAPYFTGEFSRFGFNLDHRGWSYGEAPPGAKRIKRAIEFIQREHGR